MPDQREIADAFARQARACRALGSPFTGQLCERLPNLVARDTGPVGAAIADWPLDPVESALALRLCGVLHRLVRSGQAPVLAALYPPDAETGPALDQALGDALSAHGPRLVEWLASAPQTNEVARSAILLGGLLKIAARTGFPLALLEIGSSAGVNLSPEAYAYELGDGMCWGRRDAPVTIASQWRGRLPPLDAPLRIASRAGVDLAPIDAADPAERERVLAYIWPDQPERLARTAAALDFAAGRSLEITRGDAAAWVEERLSAVPEPGIARVLMHTITWQYLPPETQTRIEAALARAGATSSADAPLAWLRLEPDGEAGSAAISLSLWPGGEALALGRGDYHGRFADWA